MDFSKVKSMVIQDSPRSRGLPYDAEVEYLESTGTQYIDTLLTISTQGTLDLSFAFHGNRPADGVECLFCARGFSGNNATNSITLFWYSANYSAASNRNKYGLDIRRNASTSRQFIPYTPGTTRHDIRIDKKAFSVDGTVLYTSADSDFITGGTLKLLHADQSNPSQPTYEAVGRLYSMAYRDNAGTLVRDFIPVRVGNIGYLYDKVSGKLFGNSGRGDFILGPDIALENLVVRKIWNGEQLLWQVPYDSRISYIETTGRLLSGTQYGGEYIDTGINPYGNAKAEIVFQYLGRNMSGPINSPVFGMQVSTTENFGLRVIDDSQMSIVANYMGTGIASGSVLGWPMDDAFHTVYLDNTGAYLDGVMAYPEYDKTMVGPLMRTISIGALHLTDTGGYNTRGVLLRIRSFKVWCDNTLVWDGYAVRKDGKGYMYEKISNRLFGNLQPDTDFILGPDVDE